MADRQITILIKDTDGKFKSFPKIPDELLDKIKQFVQEEIDNNNHNETEEKEDENVKSKSEG